MAQQAEQVLVQDHLLAHARRRVVELSRGTERESRLRAAGQLRLTSRGAGFALSRAAAQPAPGNTACLSIGQVPNSPPPPRLRPPGAGALLGRSQPALFPGPSWPPGEGWWRAAPGRTACSSLVGRRGREGRAGEGRGLWGEPGQQARLFPDHQPAPAQLSDDSRRKDNCLSPACAALAPSDSPYKANCLLYPMTRDSERVNSTTSSSGLKV